MTSPPTRPAQERPEQPRWLTLAPEPAIRSDYDYACYSGLAGPLTEPDEATAPIRLRALARARPARTTAGAIAVLLIQTGFFAWILLPAHYPVLSGDWALAACALMMLVSIYAIELFRLINLSTLCLATALARDPVPVAPVPGARVAFVTTIVPAKEPIEVVRDTLVAARHVRYEGTLDVWILDEGDDDAVRAMCAELGVHHFSRRGIERWNRPSGSFRAKTKHGNYNAWLDGPGAEYDFMLSVDPDHAPLPSFAERMLGYFRDPDVAFVVGPQVYGNYDNLVTKCAESQQFVFHGLIQRMANRFGCAMFVGTNNAVRLDALREVGGLHDSITEDMATSLVLHSSRNPASRRRWRSIYTPDVLAVGEGPSSFSDFFSQQNRWSRGTFEVLTGHFWRCFRGLSMGARMHYLLISAYYPSAALAWLLGAINCVLYLVAGTTGIRVPPEVWVAVFADIALVQFSLYATNRKHNVSPHETEGSAGAAGMFISVLSAPVYVAALIGTLTGREARFVVTPKGSSQSADGLRTFARHLAWAALFSVALGVSLWLDHPQSSMRLWSLTLIGVCLLPCAIWLAQLVDGRRRAPAGAAEPRLAEAPYAPKAEAA